MSSARGIRGVGKRRFVIAIIAMIALALCACALAEEAPVSEDAPSYLDDDRESMRIAQRRLIDLGLLDGRADGAYGPKTAAALSSYQAQNFLVQSGHLDASTYAALTDINAATASPRDIQQRLIDLGYLSGSADGIIGPRSVDALKMFQRLNEIKANGKANNETKERLFSDEAVALPETYSSGSKGEEVERLQRRLIQFGFLEGDADGSYGQSTAAAVRAFQNHLIEQGYTDGISANGQATPLTQFCLYDGRYSTYLRALAIGETDEEVRRVERRLYSLGYMDMAADDTFDDYALSALELFKTRAGLQGANVDRETVDALFSDNAPVADHCAPRDIASGDSGHSVRAVEEALLRGGLTTRMPTGQYNANLEEAVGNLYKYLKTKDDPAAELFSDPKALSKEAQKALQDGLLHYRTDDTDDQAENIRIQRRLYTLFYLPKSGIDGLFGSDTRSAVREFQTSNGWTETGKADEMTQNLLFSDNAMAKPYSYRIEVSIDRQRVEIYQLDDQKQYNLVQSFTCSTGLKNSTPRGIFLDAHPVNRWHHFEKFNCWAQYSYVITGDIMFHSVIYSSNNEKSLRSGSLYALGNPASHGCIRLKVEDAKWLFENCKRGTAVVVIY